MGDDGVDSRLLQLAALLPTIGCDAHGDAVIEQRAPRVTLEHKESTIEVPENRFDYKTAQIIPEHLRLNPPGIPMHSDQTHVTAVLLPEGLIAGILTNFVCTQHVACELSAEVVAAFAPSGADHLQDHLLQLVGPGPQVIHRPPAGGLHGCVGAGVGAPRPQVFHTLDGVGGVERSVQLQSRASDVRLLPQLEMKDNKTHFDQSDVIVIVQRVVVWVIVQLQNIKYLLGVLRLAQRMDPQDDLPSVRAEKQKHGWKRR